MNKKKLRIEMAELYHEELLRTIGVGRKELIDKLAELLYQQWAERNKEVDELESELVWADQVLTLIEKHMEEEDEK